MGCGLGLPHSSANPPSRSWSSLIAAGICTWSWAEKEPGLCLGASPEGWACFPLRLPIFNPGSDEAPLKSMLTPAHGLQPL